MGAGFHGGFGDTNGAKQNAIISSIKDVRYSRKKMEDYLLNINHPTGGAKSRFMKDVLGYSQNDSKTFHKNVISSLIGKVPTKTDITPFGVKHTYNTEIIGKYGHSVSASVVVVIQKDNGRTTYKIVTVYPNKKGTKQ